VLALFLIYRVYSRELVLALFLIYCVYSRELVLALFLIYCVYSRELVFDQVIRNASQLLLYPPKPALCLYLLSKV